MSKKILVTDSLFIFPEHEQQLVSAGYEVHRLDKPKASEEELIEAVKGKVGYILGGIESVSQKVIEAADELKAIVFTGSDWVHFVPGHKMATEKGIAIANTPGANSYAVAEYTLTLILAMTRNIFEISRTGKATFQTRPSLNELTVGIVGMGKIGSKVASMLKGIGVKQIIYYSRNQKPEVEKETGAIYADLETVLKTSDIVTLHFSKEAGSNFIDANKLSLLRTGALLINCAFGSAIDQVALHKELETGRIRAAQDDPATPDFKHLPLGVWYNSNAPTAYNTKEANKKASDMAVTSLLNLLLKGEDAYKVN